MVDLGSVRFIVVTGKGGVGKTTVAAVLALQLAARGKRVLVAMCNAKERLSAMLASDLIGPNVSLVQENVWAVNMDPERAIEEYGLLHLKSKALYALLFDNRYVRTFFRAVPGIHEWAMLGKAWWHTTEVNEDGSNRFDVVILDAPATGHGLDMLRVPKIIAEAVPPGLLRRDADRALEMLRDPRACAVVLVTLPEEMPTTETLELAGTLRDELSLPIAGVVVNAVLPQLFSAEEGRALEAITALDVNSEGDGVLFSARFRAVRERLQAESLARLDGQLGLNAMRLPLLLEDGAHPNAIRELVKHLR